MLSKKKKVVEKPKAEKAKKPASKPAPKKEAKPAPKKASKPVVKSASKPAPKKEAKPAPKKVEAEINYRNYHVVKRDDGKWEVKYAGGSKAIKLFDVQTEAVKYAKEMAKNQDGSVLVHNSKGKNKGRIKSK